MLHSNRLLRLQVLLLCLLLLLLRLYGLVLGLSLSHGSSLLRISSLLVRHLLLLLLHLLLQMRWQLNLTHAHLLRP
jgi:hypothetical protein